MYFLKYQIRKLTDISTGTGVGFFNSPIIFFFYILTSKLIARQSSRENNSKCIFVPESKKSSVNMDLKIFQKNPIITSLDSLPHPINATRLS